MSGPPAPERNHDGGNKFTLSPPYQALTHFSGTHQLSSPHVLHVRSASTERIHDGGNKFILSSPFQALTHFSGTHPFSPGTFFMSGPPAPECIHDGGNEWDGQQWAGCQVDCCEQRLLCSYRVQPD
jgi:hypothetical protein